MHRALLPALIVFAMLGLTANAADKSNKAPPPAAAAPEPKTLAEIPIGDFVSPPEFSEPCLSPDGKHLAFITKLSTGKLGIAVMDLSTGAVEPLFGSDRLDVNSLQWKSNDLLSFTDTPWGAYYDGICSISLTERKLNVFSKPAYVFWTWGRPVSSTMQFKLIDWLDSCPGRILVYGSINNFSAYEGYSLMDAATEKREVIERDDEDDVVAQVLTDHEGRIRARVRREKRTSISEVKATLDGPFREVDRSDWSQPLWKFLHLGNGDIVYVVTEKDRKWSLHAMDMRTADLGPAIFETSDGQIASVILSRDWDKLLGVRIAGDKLSFHWFDEERKKLQERLDASLPGRITSQLQESDDGRYSLFVSWSDLDPETYFILDHEHTRLMPLGKTRPKLNPALMSKMEPIKFMARDGLEIHGYLTRPVSNLSTPAPLVVIPHNGPYGFRDSWGFDSIAQIYASRGYAVLQINVRGSGGYGSDYFDAGFLEYGGKMVDDLADGAKWAVSSGFADRKRVAISGRAYGAFAALMAVARNPGVFRCAINESGDLDYSDNFPSRSFMDRPTREIVDTIYGKDPKFRRSQSPISVVDKLTIPTLHINYSDYTGFAGFDWGRFKKLLEKNKAPFEECLIYPEKPENKSDYGLNTKYQAIFAFLAKNMPAAN